MSVIHILLITVVFILLVFAIVLLVRRARRRRALSVPFPEQWRAILRKNLPVYGRLSPAMQQQLRDGILEFLYAKNLEGCGGLELTDEIRVTVAGQACLLLLGRRARCYPKLNSVLIYPSAYVAVEQDGQESVRLGESWRTGAVVLAWDSVKSGAANFSDGRNVTLHEFAHQLDQEDGAGDGAPILERPSCYASWARVLSQEFLRHTAQAARGKKGVMDAYGAGNPAEFFAVATETFFEKPRQLSRKHYELYQELRSFYRVDPLDWV